MPVPGATRSGLAWKSIADGPRELKAAIDVVGAGRRVPFVLEAPTVSTHGALPGAVMPPYCGWPSAFLPEVAGRGDDDDAGVDRALGGERQRDR